MIKENAVPEWIDWLFYLREISGAPLRDGSDQWLTYLTQKLIPKENEEISKKSLRQLIHNCLACWIPNQTKIENFLDMILEVIEYEMPKARMPRVEMGQLAMATENDETSFLFQNKIWNELMGSCLLLKNVDMQSIQESIGFDIVCQLFSGLFQAQWREDSEEGLVLQSQITWPASIDEIYGKLCEVYPDFMMDQKQLENEVLLSLCEIGVFNVIREKYNPNISYFSP